LNSTESLHYIIEEALGRIANGLTLPVGEGIAQPTRTLEVALIVQRKSKYLQDVNTTLNQRIRCAVLIFVPAVCGSDLELWHGLLYVLNLRQKLCTSEIATIHCFGTNSDGIDLRRIFGRVLHNSSLVGVEGLVSVGPVVDMSA
jgi:hypothetical protein